MLSFVIVFGILLTYDPKLIYKITIWGYSTCKAFIKPTVGLVWLLIFESVCQEPKWKAVAEIADKDVHSREEIKIKK